MNRFTALDSRFTRHSGLLPALTWSVALLALVGQGRILYAADKSPMPPVKFQIPSIVLSDDERARIEQALPDKASVTPHKPRKLLIFDLNVGYPGHRAIAYANWAFEQMGRRTGAFTTVLSRDPAVFEPERLKEFDAVFLNSTVGNLFEDARLRQSLEQFVYSGGGLMGVHGTTVAFIRWSDGRDDWPEFGAMLGGRGAAHRAADEHVFVKLDSPDHPLNRAFGGKDFDYRDEFFRVQTPPYSRDRQRILFSIDTDKTDLTRDGKPVRPERADNDYALAWVRSHGRGRVFYSTIGHNPAVFWDSTMLQFYLDAAQFVLGDLPASTIPSGKLTPARQAEEKLGWRLALTAYTFHKFTLFEAIDKTAQLGLPYLEGLSFQKVSKDIPKDFTPDLSDDELRQIRAKLDAAGVRLLSYYYHRIPGDEAGCRKVFEFGRKMGIEVFLSEPEPQALDTIERFCDAYNICVAIHNHDQKGSPVYWRPEGVLEVCRGRSKRIGACADLGYWMRSGIDPAEAVRLLKDRLLTVQVHDLDQRTFEGQDVPWGAGAGQTARFFGEVQALGLKPLVVGLEYSRNWFDSLPEIKQCKEFYEKTCLELAQ
jgi:type 1 glutamine amidotransferase/sugar phosphate isomerase/epimerase